MQKVLILSGNYNTENNERCAGFYTAAGLVKLGIHADILAKFESENGDKINADAKKIIAENCEIFRDCESVRESVLNTDFDAVFITGDFVRENGCEEFLRKICETSKQREASVVFDPDMKNEKNIDEINKAAALCETFVPSVEDAKILCGSENAEEIAEHYLKSGAKKVVVSLDKQGAFFKSGLESGSAPTFRAEQVVDTTGAGDAFAAGLLSGLLEKIPLGEAVVRANACGSIIIRREGFCFPDMSELREYMLSHRFVVDGCKEF